MMEYHLLNSGEMSTIAAGEVKSCRASRRSVEEYMTEETAEKETLLYAESAGYYRENKIGGMQRDLNIRASNDQSRHEHEQERTNATFIQRKFHQNATVHAIQTSKAPQDIDSSSVPQLPLFYHAVLLLTAKECPTFGQT